MKIMNILDWRYFVGRTEQKRTFSESVVKRQKITIPWAVINRKDKMKNTNVSEIEALFQIKFQYMIAEIVEGLSNAKTKLLTSQT